MKAEALTSSILSKISVKNKWYKEFFVHIVLLFLSLRGKYNFLNMSRYGGKVESTYRSRFKGKHHMDKFNLKLIEEQFQKDLFWAFDPSYLKKSGKKSYGAGYFWSGGAQTVKWGQELCSLAAVSSQERTALHYKVVQTPSKLKEGQSLLDYYASVFVDEKEQLQKLSKHVVADAYFSKAPFVDKLKDANFEFISRFRSDVQLRYLYAGCQKGGKGKCFGQGKGSGGGAPKKYDGKVKLKELNLQYFTPCCQEEDEMAYEAVVYANSLKRIVRVVVIQKLNSKKEVLSAKVLFSTNPQRLGMDILLEYRLRFQQEFLFRDAKQFLGLNDCQARSKEQMDFHLNMSFTALNVAKSAHFLTEDRAEDAPFSMADIKTEYFNQLTFQKALNLFISLSGIDPNIILNNPQVAQLLNLGKIAA